MVDITPSIKADKKILTSYGAGRFVVSGQEFAHSILIGPDAVADWQPPEPFTWSDALVEELLPYMNHIEILLVGSGKTIRPIPPLLKGKFKAAGIAVDVMDTGAACRTYNVLLSEERKVAAALVVV